MEKTYGTSYQDVGSVGMMAQAARAETKYETACRAWAHAKEVLVNAHDERNRAEAALQQALQNEEATWNALADTAGRGLPPTLPMPNRPAR